jgi:alpha-glucosidase
MLLLTLRGTPTLYYGDELGMTNVTILPQDVHDPAEKNEPGLGQGRDPERTPMPWDSSPSAGFSDAKPWLPLGVEHAQVNVANLLRDQSSALTLYHALIHLRRTNEVLISGGIEGVVADKAVLHYERRDGDQNFAIFLNFSQEQKATVSARGQVVVSTHLDREKEMVRGTISVRPSEGLIVRLD